MEFENRFSVPLAAEEAWIVLMDVERMVPCFPGAELTEVVSADRFRGRINVRLGPMAMAFAGTARIEERNDAAHTARIMASGDDGKGRGHAEAVVHFGLQAGDGETDVVLKTDLQLSGSVAQFARGGTMIRDVATRLIGRFEENLRGELASGRPRDAAPATKPPGSPSDTRSIGGFGLLLAAAWSALLSLIGRPFRKS